MSKLISTTINDALHQKAKNYGIKWSEALRVGITTILARNGDDDYLNPLQLNKMVMVIQKQLQEANEEIDRLREYNQQINNKMRTSKSFI